MKEKHTECLIKLLKLEWKASRKHTDSVTRLLKSQSKAKEPGSKSKPRVTSQHMLTHEMTKGTLFGKSASNWLIFGEISQADIC